MAHPKRILSRYGIRAKKSLGQNFLYDDNLLARITSSADLSPEDTVLEIGPGIGALTRHLSMVAGRVVAVEIDGRLLPVLEDQLSDCDNVEIVHGNVLSFDPADHFRTGYKVVANIPYYATGAILRHLLSCNFRPSSAVFTVQEEVAERIAADPGGMTKLAVSVQLYSQVKIMFRISAGSFWPRPDVASAVIRLDLRDEPLLDSAQEKLFFQLVEAGFHQRRKQLQGNLRTLGYSAERISAALNATGIDGRRRAETLSVEDWLALYNALS